jgi:hypothetical protein
MQFLLELLTPATKLEVRRVDTATCASGITPSAFLLIRLETLVPRKSWDYRVPS